MPEYSEYRVAILSSRRGNGNVGNYKLSEIDECFVVDKDAAWRIPF